MKKARTKKSPEPITNPIPEEIQEKQIENNAPGLGLTNKRMELLFDVAAAVNEMLSRAWLADDTFYHVRRTYVERLKLCIEKLKKEWSVTTHTET